jgi:hypothetical protein
MRISVKRHLGAPNAVQDCHLLHPPPSTPKKLKPPLHAFFALTQTNPYATLNLKMSVVTAETNPSLVEEAYDFVMAQWGDEARFKNVTKNHIPHAILSYDKFMSQLVAMSQPNAKYIHKERILYDLFKNNKIMVLRYNPKYDDLDAISENTSLYSYAEYMEDSTEAMTFINGVRVMEEQDYVAQLSANEFVGGYWEPEFHWVITVKSLRAAMKKAD